jgi:hypothetical protein
MKLNQRAGRALAALLLIGSIGLPLSAQTRLNISASNCIPRSADEFDESSAGPDGFRWEGSQMINKDDDESQDSFVRCHLTTFCEISAAGQVQRIPFRTPITQAPAAVLQAVPWPGTEPCGRLATVCR